MSDEKSPGQKTPGQIILGWWARNIGDRNTGRARALAARLRRADQVSALTEPEVHDLARDLNLRDAAKLARLVTLLAEVADHAPQTLAKRLGGAEPLLSTLRFQRLMRAEEPELTTALRRAIAMADRRCNVAHLGLDALHWSEACRARWCFHYFGAEAPAEDMTEPCAEISE